LRSYYGETLSGRGFCPLANRYIFRERFCLGGGLLRLDAYYVRGYMSTYSSVCAAAIGECCAVALYAVLMRQCIDICTPEQVRTIMHLSTCSDAIYYSIAYYYTVFVSLNSFGATLNHHQCSFGILHCGSHTHFFVFLPPPLSPPFPSSLFPSRPSRFYARQQELL